MSQGYPRGSIVMANLEPVLGSEQGRKRPCIVVSHLPNLRASKARDLYTIVPCTRSEALIGPLAPRILARSGGLPADSVALCLHIRTIAPERIDRAVGQLNPSELEPIVAGILHLVTPSE